MTGRWPTSRSRNAPGSHDRRRAARAGAPANRQAGGAGFITLLVLVLVFIGMVWLSLDGWGYTGYYGYHRPASGWYWGGGASYHEPDARGGGARGGGPHAGK